jgi:hypothetical protein
LDPHFEAHSHILFALGAHDATLSEQEAQGMTDPMQRNDGAGLTKKCGVSRRQISRVTQYENRMTNDSRKTAYKKNEEMHAGITRQKQKERACSKMGTAHYFVSMVSCSKNKNT